MSLVPNTVVALGGFTFTDFAVPPTINAGGKQRMHVHKLVGGARVIDTLGPDPDDITWQGIFRGNGAIGRAEALDAMRISGRQLPLSWHGIFRLVVISHFKFETEQRYEVPYHITVTPVSDGGNGGALSGLASAFTTVIAGDIGALVSLGALLA